MELEDGEKLEYMDTDKEITMEDFLELEEWLDSLDEIPGYTVELEPAEDRIHKSEVSHAAVH